MARAKIQHRWPDGTTTTVTIKAKASYPDACAEATARVLDLYRATCAADVEDEAE